MKLRQFDAVQFRSKMQRGLNRPFLVLALPRDGGERSPLVVKSRAGYGDRPEAMLKELFSLLLARELGLNTPEPVLVNLQPGFEFGAADYPDSAALIRESFGWNLATVHLGEGWKQWMQGSLPRSISEQSIVGAYAFDAMVQNSDREVENPNLLWRGEELALLDFDRAFAFLRIEEIEPRPWRNTLISQNLNRHCLYPHLPNWKEGEIIAVSLWDSFNEWWVQNPQGQISQEITVGFADPELDLPRLEEYLAKFAVATEDFFQVFDGCKSIMSLEPYSFSFLRYVHEPLSGEFANVGVLLWAPESRYLGFKASHKYRRLSHFFDGFHHQDYRSLISRIETKFEAMAISFSDAQANLSLEKKPESARELAFRVIPFDDAALQWSQSGGGLTDSPQAELEGLFWEAVARHYESDDEARRDDASIFREIYSRAFESPVVKPHVKEHEVVAPYAAHVFPQAWKNGVWNVYQPLSFDLKRGENIRNKAYHWESLTRFLSQAPEQPNIHLLLAAPSGEHQNDYLKARDVLNSSRLVTLVEENEASDFANDLESRLIAAGEDQSIQSDIDTLNTIKLLN